MKLRPVKHGARPGYPARDILAEHPELLRLVPERWRHNALALGALSGVLSLLTACGRQEAKAGADAAAAPATVAKVAPLFGHGTGRAEFGGDTTGAPALLSENDAQAIIRDEAKRGGLEFVAPGPTLAQVTVPIADPSGEADEETSARQVAARKQRRTQRLPLALDGLDRKRQIAFEYVSAEDFDEWQDGSWRSTVLTYDLKSTAARLRPGLGEVKQPLTVGVFYDPMAETSGPNAPGAEAARPAAPQRPSEKLLRQQVRDFIAWLKAQGVI